MLLVFLLYFLELYAAYWKISDVLIKIKRSIVEAVEIWNMRLSEATRKRDTDKKKDRPSQIELDSSVDETVNLDLSNGLQTNEQLDKGASNLIFKKLKSLDSECKYFKTLYIPYSFK